MTNTTSMPRRRIVAFARRTWLQQGTTAVWLAALVGGGLGVLVFLGSGSVNTLSNLQEMIPADPGGLVVARDSAGGFLPMTSYLLTMTPAFLGALVAIVATLTLPGVVADDISGGGIEVLLASPIPRQRLFDSYLGAALALTAVAWIVAVCAFGIVAVVASFLAGVSISLSLGYGVALVALPLSMGVWSATATLFGALLHPHSLDSRAGMNGGPIRLVALLPALVVIPSVLFLPGWVLPAIVAVLIVSLLASLALIRLTARGFRSTRVLGT
ncbi:hypothetical protein [Propioniciclava flava]|uniref:Uncharacterized protein n=1 Tax=Propioniciclava flava TaxID=2072026 RepID=A0A4Q2EGE8_9ACTN|nr:hypothetical protein [Propioniciclava flava]RXW32607.1 hypothetical protein C1706_05460 [Propioniciclava flava]